LLIATSHNEQRVICLVDISTITTPSFGGAVTMELDVKWLYLLLAAIAGWLTHLVTHIVQPPPMQTIFKGLPLTIALAH